ncbi:hypothetical protein [Microbispora sp. NPDC049633]|uniref:hypothetical protein n=1 Tax=Microbispora sp. NPDC049633 TaxID=3154355 RepID=UPI003423C9CE
MHRNEVTLAGRLSMEPAHRELPSGALLTQWRLAVRRPGGRPGFHRSDAIECATFDDGVRDMLAGWRLDDLVEVEGALRRRWWRGGSRYEIEVRRARRVEPAVPARRRRRRAPRAGDDTAIGDTAAGDATLETAQADAAAEAAQADAGAAATDAREAVGRGEVAEASSGGAAQPADLTGSPGGQAAVSPAPSSCDQRVADSGQPAGEVVSQWRRSA